jgi:hypothetical protein
MRSDAESRPAPRRMIRSGMPCWLPSLTVRLNPSFCHYPISRSRLIPSFLLRHARSHNFTNHPPNLFLPIRLPEQGPSQDLCGSRTPAPKVVCLKQNNKRVNLISNLGKITRIGIGKTAFTRLSCILTCLSGRRGKNPFLGATTPCPDEISTCTIAQTGRG